MSSSVAVRHPITAVRVASILLHDRRAVVDVVSVRIGLLRNAIGTVERAVLAAGVCRVVPGSSAVTVVGCTSIVRIVVTMLRIEAVCAVRAAGVHTLCVAIAGRKCSRSHTDIRVAVGTTRCIVSAGVLRAILIAARVVVCIGWSVSCSIRQRRCSTYCYHRSSCFCDFDRGWCRCSSLLSVLVWRLWPEA